MDSATPLTIGTTAVGGALSAASAFGQNRAVKRSMSSLERAYRTERDQTDAAFELEQQKRARVTRQVLGRLRVLEAESGSAGGSFAALEAGTAIDNEINRTIIETNRVNQQRSLSSQFAATAARLAGQKTNAALAGMQGALSGLGAGLQIESGLAEMDAAKAAKKAQEEAALAYVTSLPLI